MSPKVICFIQAREGSTRFPRKIHAPFGDYGTVLQYVLRAAQAIPGVTEARVILPTDFPAVAESDVLGRYAAAADKADADVIMRLTGDCPLFDPQVGAIVLGRFFRGLPRYGDPRVYVSNVYPRRTWPDGMDCEVFTRELLDEATVKATDPSDREHVTPWMQRNAPLIRNVKLPVDWSHVRLTVDTPEDLAWLRQCLTAPRS